RVGGTRERQRRQQVRSAADHVSNREWNSLLHRRGGGNRFSGEARRLPSFPAVSRASRPRTLSQTHFGEPQRSDCPELARFVTRQAIGATMACHGTRASVGKFCTLTGERR